MTQLEKMKELVEAMKCYRDEEHGHYEADKILLRRLIELGEYELVKSYFRVKKACGAFYYA